MSSLYQNLLQKNKPERNLSTMKDIPWDLHQGIEPNGQTFVKSEENLQYKLKL